MIESFKNFSFWSSVAHEFLTSNIAVNIFLLVILVIIWMWSKDSGNSNSEKTKNIFWGLVLFSIVLNAYFLYDAYDIKSSQKMNGPSIFKQPI